MDWVKLIADRARTSGFLRVDELARELNASEVVVEMHFAAKRTAGWSSTLERRFSSTDLYMISPAGSSSTCLDRRLTYP